MRRRWLPILLALIGLIVGVTFLRYFSRGSGPAAGPPLISGDTMRIDSSAFAMGEAIPKEYSCDGRNVNPPLRFVGLPENAKSLALIVDDPDAPAGTWTHWTVWNLDATTAELSADWKPTNGEIEGLTSFGRAGWGGPCPPSGMHRYFFKIFALDVMLTLGPSADVQELEAAMRDHVIDKAGIFGTYSR